MGSLLNKVARRRRRRWGGRAFRFSPASFRPGMGVSLRRFSVTEAGQILAMAYLASKGLGVIRQSLFNALFGTGAPTPPPATRRSACPTRSST